MNTLSPCRRCWTTPRPTEGFVVLRWIVATQEALATPVWYLAKYGPHKPREMEVSADAFDHWVAKIRYSADLNGQTVLALWTVKGKG